MKRVLFLLISLCSLFAQAERKVKIRDLVYPEEVGLISTIVSPDYEIVVYKNFGTHSVLISDPEASKIYDRIVGLGRRPLDSGRMSHEVDTTFFTCERFDFGSRGTICISSLWPAKYDRSKPVLTAGGAARGPVNKIFFGQR
ncbi:MAG: hypothetical protein AB7O96_11375 [Pseudobdellovibrionaceae bacterium]